MALVPRRTQANTKLNLERGGFLIVHMAPYRSLMYASIHLGFLEFSRNVFEAVSGEGAEGMADYTELSLCCTFFFLAMADFGSGHTGCSNILKEWRLL